MSPSTSANRPRTSSDVVAACPGARRSTTTTRSSTTSCSTSASSAPSRSCTATTRSRSTRSWRSTPTRVLHLARARAVRRTPGSVERRRSARFGGAACPVLGVCLGHQCIGQVFGGDVVRAPTRDARQDVARSATTARACSPGCPTRSRRPATTRSSSTATRCPTCSRSPPRPRTASMMGLRHRELPIEGVQFHPESILTDARPRPARATSSLRSTARSEQDRRRARVPVAVAVPVAVPSCRCRGREWCRPSID